MWVIVRSAIKKGHVLYETACRGQVADDSNEEPAQGPFNGQVLGVSLRASAVPF